MTKNQKKIRSAARWAARQLVGEAGFVSQVGGSRRLNLVQERGIALLKARSRDPNRFWSASQWAAFDAAEAILAKAGMK